MALKTKSIFNYLVILSFIFLVIALYRADYLNIPTIHSYPYLLLSFLILFCGMISNALTWWNLLSLNGFKVKIKDAISSVGLSIFTKYIPGKVLLILGKAEFIATRYPIKREVASTVSLQTQIITIWAGFSLGCIGLLLAGGFSQLKILYTAIPIWLFLTSLIFLPIIKIIIERSVKWILKKDINIPTISPLKAIKSIPVFMLNWFLWGLSFYYLCLALTFDINFSLIAVLTFPFAGTSGAMAIVAPGGVGVREGLIVVFLGLLSIDVVEATTISVASRLWFLIGELFIFSFAFVLHKFIK